MPSHELDNDAWLEDQALTPRRSPLSARSGWPTSTDPAEARLLAERAVGIAPARAQQPEPPQAELLRLAKKAFPDLVLRVGMYCDVNHVSGTSPWRFVLRASGMELGAARPEAVGDTPQGCIDALIKKVAPIRRQVIEDREEAHRNRHKQAA